MQGVPEVIDFGRGTPMELPDGWSTESGGKKAANYAAHLNAKLYTAEGFQLNRDYWAAFRLMGYADFVYASDDPKLKAKVDEKKVSVQKGKYTPHVEHSPWTKEGVPAQGGIQGRMPLRSLLKLLRDVKAEAASYEEPDPEEAGGSLWEDHWLAVVEQLNEPGGAWKCPFLLPIIKLEDIIVENEALRFRVYLYAGRLLFYLIADEALGHVLNFLIPVSTVIPTGSVADGRHPIRFTRGKSSANPFSIAGIMRAAEHEGYTPATQPLGVALTMKEYQLHTLQWMIDQENLIRGLNGCFWEARSWYSSDSPLFTTLPESERYFYVSTTLGELRLEEPPLVRGGLLCEEMGLGKTLELVALIKATKDHKPCLPAVSPKRPEVTETKATLVVVPDTLIPQWRQEIAKSCMAEDQLEVIIYVQEPGGRSVTQDLTPFLECDICLTTFKTVENDKNLQRLMWRRVVIDEMQMIRSSTTKVAQMCENLSAHARWMVSGTPLYASVNDLNGLLNFLNVIPFSLSDAKDGFWSQRLGKPLASYDTSALNLLHHFLRCIMMRHSKAQRYALGPLAGKSILELPAMHSVNIGVQFDKYEERAAYRHLEALGVRAVQAQIQVVEGQRQDRPAVIAADMLRTQAVSPNLLTGGCGVSSEMARVARLWRALVPIQFDELNMTPQQIRERKVDLFANPIALPGERVRDLFLKRSANSGDTKQLDQADIAQRLEEATEKVSQNKRVLTFEKAGSFEGLPWRRWKWLLRCITSGRYVLLQLCRLKSKKKHVLKSSDHEVYRLFDNCPVLSRRALFAFAKLRPYILAEVHYLGFEAKYMKDPPESLMGALFLTHSKRITATVEVSEGYFESHEQLWFKPSEHMPSKPPTLGESIRHAQDSQWQPDDEGDDAAGEDDRRAKIDSREGSMDVVEDRLASNRLTRQRRKEQVAEAVRAKTNTGKDWFDFFAHESFWRKAMAKILMQKHSQEKAEAEELRAIWETSVHPGRETFSLKQLIHCAKHNPDLCFEAVFWYASSNESKYSRTWFCVEGTPQLVDEEGDSTLVRVKFLDGQERIVDISEVRLARSEWFEDHLVEKKVTIETALKQLRLQGFENRFADLALQENGLEQALSLSKEELFKRLINDRDLEALEKGSESKKRAITEQVTKRIERFRTASLLSETRQALREVFHHARKVREALESMPTKVLSFDETTSILKQFVPPEVASEAIWRRIWNQSNGDRSGETVDWITVALGLKGSNPLDAAAKDIMPAKLEALKPNSTVLVKLSSESKFASMGAGWFQGEVVRVPKQNINEPPRWTVRLSHGELNTDVLRLSVGPSDIRVIPKSTGEKHADDDMPTSSKKRKRNVEEADDGDEGDDWEMKNDSGENDHGAKKFLDNGLLRMKYLANALQPTIAAKERERILLVDITAAKTALPDLERYETLLIRTYERAGTAGVKLASQQGYQALEQLISRDLNVEDPKCAICDELLVEKGPIILNCLHFLCRECLYRMKTAHDITSKEKPLSCPFCRRDIDPLDMYLVLPPPKPEPLVEELDSADDLALDAVATSSEDQPFNPSWTRALNEQEVHKHFMRFPENVSQWDPLSSHFTGLPRPFQTFLRLSAGVPALGCSSAIKPAHWSSKVSRVIADIRQVTGKVVVFSQFARAVTMFMFALKEEGIPAASIKRGDHVDSLRAAIESFTLDDNFKVLVIHSGSGAAGLTLTVAHHVFLLEPFLQAGEEAQAINRVHRIGQHETVESRCYVLQGTIEERILAWRQTAPSARRTAVTSNGNAPDEEDIDDEGGLVILPSGKEDSRSVALFSNEFLSFCLGVSNNVI